MKFEKEFREKYPESVGEQDSMFDMSNYVEFLESKVEKLTSTNKQSTPCYDHNDKMAWWKYCPRCGKKY